MSMSREDLRETRSRRNAAPVVDNPSAARLRRERLETEMAAYLANGGEITQARVAQLRARLSQSAHVGATARVWVEVATADGQPPRKRRVVDALFAGERAKRGG